MNVISHIFATFMAVIVVQAHAFGFGSLLFDKPHQSTETVVLSERSFSLNKRYGNQYVSDIFAKNILLTLAYMRGTVKSKQDVNWNNVTKPFHYSFNITPGQIFAFHNELLPEYKNKVVRTTNANFSYGQGFLNDGWLTGDGVCHLASLIYWAAKDAGLATNNVIPHDFAVIPQVPRKYGVAIYDDGTADMTSELQNLYVDNNKKTPVTISFDYNGDLLKVSVLTKS